jgi:multidrug resistance efflux pump
MTDDLEPDTFTEDSSWLSRRVVALQAQLATANHDLANARTQINLLEADRLAEYKRGLADAEIYFVAERDRLKLVVQAARRRLASCDRAWDELGCTPEDLEAIDFNGEWAALRAALDQVPP